MSKRETCLRHGYNDNLVRFYYSASFYFVFYACHASPQHSHFCLVHFREILAKLLNPSLVVTSDLGWGFSTDI